MADLIDEAQARDMAFTAAAIAQRRRPFICEASPGPRDCVDCGDAIPEERLAACNDAARCIDCQRGFDAKARHLATGRR